MVLIWLSFLLGSANIFAGGRIGELVFSFDEPKPFTYSEDPIANTLILNFIDVKPSDLSLLDQYDESIIRRVVIREDKNSGTKVTLSLRDQNLLATIDEYNEPYRIVIKVFDKDFNYENDPQTGLPLLNSKPVKNYFDNSQLKQGEDLNTTHVNLGNKQIVHQNKARDKDDFPLLKQNKGQKESGAKHQLLKPQIEALRSSEPLAISIEQESPGRGPGWATYPLFAYPTQLAALGDSELNIPSRNLTADQAMADFAFKQFSFGHEKRALIGYQKVLHQEPRIFRKFPHHLWAMAEAHFGLRNLALADSYFEMLIEQFPDKPHSQHAYLRRLDIQAIKMIETHEAQQLQTLLLPLEKLSSKNNAEIETQKSIRQCYWSPPFPADFSNDPSLCDQENLNDLKRTENQVESKKTKFLAENLILFNALSTDHGWDKELEQRGLSYFNTYDSNSGSPFYETLKDLYTKKAIRTITLASRKNNDALAVGIDQKLPRELDTVRNNALTARSLAKSNRRLGQEVKALFYYELAQKYNNELEQQFEASFWIAVLSSRLATLDSRANGNADSPAIYKTKARKADRRLQEIWNDMNTPIQNKTRALFHTDMRETLNDPPLLKTPAKILLGSWKSLLTSEGSKEEPPKDNYDWANSFSGAPVQVRLLRDLIDRFKKLGLNDERKQATKLLKLIKPKDMADDREAQNVWTKQLASLADEYRSNQEYLKAGRLFSFMANESIDWEDRAESFYKGGLLLYRAGKREEAINSLTQASQDGNNLFYANLAKERLTQLRP